MLRRLGLIAALTALAIGGAACAARKARPPQVTPVTQAGVTPLITPFPTVPPRTPTPVAAAPLPTRPVKSAEAEKARQAGKPIGPVITFLGITRADGRPVEPAPAGADGVPTFVNYIGSGFQLVVEGKPGISNLEVGRRVFAYDPKDARLRPDLEIQVNRTLGDGSLDVCDRRRPNIGGIPAINPPSFAETRKISDAMNDFACRFETFIESASSCTLDKYGDYSFIRGDSTNQFCMIVARAWNFPIGDTLVSARLRDSEGNPGPVKRVRLRRPKEMPPRPRVEPMRTPTPSRRRP